MRHLLASRFLRNIAALQAGGLLLAGMSFASGIALAGILGAHEQGAWIVANQLYALAFFVVNLGLLQVAVTQVAAACARDQQDKVAAWLACLIKAYLLMGGGLLLAGWFAIPRAVELWRSFNPDIDPRVGTWAWCLLATPLLDIPRVVVIAAFQGTRRMVRLAQVENAGEVLRSFLVIAGAILTGTPWGPVIGALSGTLIAGVVAIELYRRANKEEDAYRLPGVMRIMSEVRSVPIRSAFRQGIQFGLVRQADALGKKILPPLIIQTFSSSAWVAYFRIAQSLMDVPLMLMQGVGRTALPALSELRGLKDHTRFKSLFTRTTLLGGGVIALGILAFLPLVPLVLRFLPADYTDPVWTLCLILTLYTIPIGFTITLDSFYLLTGRMRVGVRLSILGMVIGVCAMLVFSGGSPGTGVAWGMVVLGAFGFVHLGYVVACFRSDPELGRPTTEARTA